MVLVLRKVVSLRHILHLLLMEVRFMVELLDLILVRSMAQIRRCTRQRRITDLPMYFQHLLLVKLRDRLGVHRQARVTTSHIIARRVPMVDRTVKDSQLTSKDLHKIMLPSHRLPTRIKIKLLPGLPQNVKIIEEMVNPSRKISKVNLNSGLHLFSKVCVI